MSELHEAKTHPVHYDFHISGEAMEASSKRRYDSVNPASGEVWASIAEADISDVDMAVRSAHSAYTAGVWRSMSPTQRGVHLRQFAAAIDRRSEHIAAIEVCDNGKLYREMVAQLRSVSDWLIYYSGLADKLEGHVIPVAQSTVLNYTLYEPLGVIGIITPWNSPVLLSIMAIAPALAAGNTVVVKPSEHTPASIIEVARLATEAGLPDGVINVVTGGRAAGEALVEHPLVRMISFTGSTEIGRSIAGKASGRLARVTTELGGKSPNIVFADADLEAAEAGILAGIFAAAGQTCVAGSRALLAQEIYEEMLERLAVRARSIRIGLPMNPETQMGPIATLRQLEKIETIVDEARSEGGQVVTGGKRVEAPELRQGFFFEPTILLAPDGPCRAAVEEIFGPVLTVAPFDSEEQAVALANDTDFGLAAGVWTADLKRAHRMARRLEAGTIWINTYRALSFASPFGGYKQSGLGRMNGSRAVYQYLQEKSVWCELGDERQDPFLLRL